MAVGGVILGVAALVIILSVTNGFAGEVKNRLIGMNAHVNIRRFDGGPIADWDALLQQVQGAAGVVGAAPVVDSKVIIASQLDLGRVDGIPVWGIDPATFPAVSDLTEHLRYRQASRAAAPRLARRAKTSGGLSSASTWRGACTWGWVLRCC